MQKALRLAAFAAVLLIAFFLFLGWRPWQLLSSPPDPPPAVATRREAPTVAVEPTLTAGERKVAETWNTRAASMITAARDLQQLGQAVQADVAWKGKVRAASSTITGGAAQIQLAPLPSRYGPLTSRAKAATNGCAATVGKLPDVDSLTTASVAALSGELDQCVAALEKLQLSLSGL